MTKPLVLLIGTPLEDYLACLRDYFTVDVLRHQKDQAAFLKANAHKYDALAGNAAQGASAEFMAQFPNLKMIGSSGVGYDAYALDYAKAHGIHITNTPDVLNAAVADTAVMLLLASVRHLIQADQWVRSGAWPIEKYYPLVSGIEGKTCGILGLGRIGLEIAKRCTAFGLNVVYHNRHPRKDVPYRYYDNLNEMAEAVDYLILALPGNTGGEHIINAEVLSKLGKDGVLINIARGIVVDEAALITALQSRTIAGAGLDVFQHEPHVPEALKALDNVILLPHLASGTIQTRGAMTQLAVDNLRAYFAGKPLLTPVC